MLDGAHRDTLAERVQQAQISALHRALDEAWLAGYAAGQQASEKASVDERDRRHGS
jgi:hypothetical protein